MFSATVYSIGHSFKPSVYEFNSSETKYLGDPDFLTIYGVVIDFASLNTTPAFVIFCLKYQPGVENAGADTLGKLIGWLVIAQSALFLFGLFVTSKGENYSRFYMSIMPHIKHYSILVAEIIMPILIFLISLIGMLGLPEFDDINRVMYGADYMFVMLS